MTKRFAYISKKQYLCTLNQNTHIMEQEIWKDIPGYEGLYQVSSLGRVKSVSRVVVGKDNKIHTLKERILKPQDEHNGYLIVGLCKNGVAKMTLVHRLVAEAFISNVDLFATTVNHKNEIKTDNRVDNLEWMSGADNTRYSTFGSKHYFAKPVRCIETGQVFGCARDASRWLGLNNQSISESIRRGYRCGGYHWELI